MAAQNNNNVVRVVPDIVPGSTWVRAETKNVLLQNCVEVVRDILKMEFPEQRYYNVIPQKDGAIFVQFFFTSFVKKAHGHVWGSGPATVTFYSVPFDAKDNMPLA